MKRWLIWGCLSLFFLFGLAGLTAAQSSHPVYLFYGKYCPHCEREREFLADLQSRHPDLVIREFEVSENRENNKLFGEVISVLPTDVRGVPVTVVGDKVFNGFLNAETTGKQIEAAIEVCCREECPDLVAPFLTATEPGPEVSDQECGEPAEAGLKIKLPFIGEINPAAYSLPVLTVMIAAVDGFNPCAMWVLLFLISLLLGMKDRKKMWILGGSFIAASAVMYFLFLTAWLKFFLFIGWISWVRYAIGLVAIGSGAYHLREFWVNRTGTCKTVSKTRKKLVVQKMQTVINSRIFILAVIGMIVLAFGVNLIELVCSAGLPAIYTQVLALSNVSSGRYYAYLLLYIFVFMLDDLFIFWLAMRTLEMVGISSKYSRFSNLIGGGLILLLGILLIFKPEWIMFG